MPTIRIHTRRVLGICGVAAALAAAPRVGAQDLQGMHDDVPATARSSSVPAAGAGSPAYTFTSRADSISWARHKALAERSSGFRIVVSLEDRRLWAIAGRDTVLSAPAAVARGTTLDYAGSEWKFVMPRGVRTVLATEADPIWQPPEWEYAEAASAYGLKLGHIDAEHPTTLRDGRLLSVEEGVVGIVSHDRFAALPVGEHIVFDSTLFVPPLGTKNRMVEGELGKYALVIGNGFLIHGTPNKESIGLAATHGCVRLRDEDIAWLYEHVGGGVKVYVY